MNELTNRTEFTNSSSLQNVLNQYEIWAHRTTVKDGANELLSVHPR